MAYTPLLFRDGESSTKVMQVFWNTLLVKFSNEISPVNHVRLPSDPCFSALCPDFSVAFQHKVANFVVNVALDALKALFVHAENPKLAIFQRELYCMLRLLALCYLPDRFDKIQVSWERVRVEKSLDY